MGFCKNLIYIDIFFKAKKWEFIIKPAEGTN